MNILLVEDEAVPALDLGMRLEGFGHKVLAHADSGVRAVEYASSLKPNIVLMDIKLKGDMDGVEAARTIGKNDNIPVVFMTAFSDRETLKRSMSIAPHGYVLKPVNDRDLFITLEAALVRSRLEKNLQHRLQIEEMFYKIVSRAATAHSIDHFLSESLRLIGNTMSVSRVYFLEYDADRQVLYNTHEWCAAGIPPLIDVRQNRRDSRYYNFFYHRLLKNEPFVFGDIELLPEEAAAEKESLREQGVTSIIIVPAVSGGSLRGFVGFDSVRCRRNWSDVDTHILKIFSEMCLRTLERRNFPDTNE